MQDLVQASGMDFSTLEYYQSTFNQMLNNGGPPNFPNVIGDDSKTTDEVLMRRMYYPNKDTREFFSDASDPRSLNFQFENNQLDTIMLELDKLKMRGISIRGQEYYGGNNDLILDSTGTYSTTRTDPSKSYANSTGALLWIVVIIGAVSLLAAATSRNVTV